MLKQQKQVMLNEVTVSKSSPRLFCIIFIFKILFYLKEKVDRAEAEVLYWQKMLEPFDKYGRMDAEACMEHTPFTD